MGDDEFGHDFLRVSTGRYLWFQRWKGRESVGDPDERIVQNLGSKKDAMASKT